MLKVALDAGHGRNTSGKRNPDDEREWKFNNEVLLACQKKLSTYTAVQLLRLDDPTGKIDIPLRTRTNKANQWGADVLISIHHNALSGNWGTHQGIETYIYPDASKASRDIAELVQTRMVRAMGLRNRGVKTANFHMLRESKMPAILTEGGFIDSTIDIQALRNKEKMRAQGEAIAEGIAQYFKLESKKQKAKIVYDGDEIEGFIEDGRTYVQIRSLAELLGLKIEWDQKNNKVTLRKA